LHNFLSHIAEFNFKYFTSEELYEGGCLGLALKKNRVGMVVINIIPAKKAMS
jgi:hypothetical protein